MEPTLAAALTAEVTGWANDALTQFTAVLPIAIGVALGVSVVYFAIKHLRGMAHV